MESTESGRQSRPLQRRVRAPRLIFEVNEGSILPAWYGLAWHRYHKLSAVCMPLPFNILAAALRGVWIWLRFGFLPVPCNPLDAYWQGLQDGRRSNAQGEPTRSRPTDTSP